jgi:uncharacterized protein (DUF1501 family)
MSQSKSNHERSFQSRRNLLKMGGACGAMTNSTFLSTLMHLKMTNAVMADDSPITPNGGYRALVCLFFNGAIDSFNVLTPHGTTQNDASFAEYAATRTGAALKRRDPTNSIDDGDWVGTDYGYLNPIVDTPTGRVFGLHPRFTYLKQIYDAGHATFVANCGSLVEPIANNGEFNAKTKPIGLYSHPDLQRHWQTAVPTSRNQVKGWAGKMMDLMTAPGNSATDIYSAISTSGQSLMLTGNRITSYTIGSITSTSAGGSTPLTGINGTPSYDRIYTGVQSDYASQAYADVLERTIRNNRAEARDAAAALNAVWGTTTLPGAPNFQFPTSGLGSQLAAVAKAIKIAKNATTTPLQQQRQVFMCTIGGWDHHASLLNTQNTMIPAIDQGLKAFYDFMVAENLLDNVTLFTISDFARTWSFNGSGTDHAWGGNPFVMGGAVNMTPSTKRIWGTYPNVVLDTSSTGLDRGRGVIIPQTSTDLYHAEICRWFGVPQSRLVDVLPGIGNFSYQGGSQPVGFLKNYAP